MGRNRFVGAETARLDLSDGDWVDVKRRLNNADQKKLEATMFRRRLDVTGTPSLELDWENADINRVMIWVVDWSFVDDRGKSVPFSLSAVRNLDLETMTEISAALDAHITALDEEKKATRRSLTPVSEPETMETAPAS